MKIGIIGTGNIANYLLETINSSDQLRGEITSVFGRNKEIGESLKIKYNISFFTDFQRFIESPIDIVIEAATIEVAKKYIKEILANEKSVVLSSVGALKESDFLAEIKEIANLNSKCVFLPTGAIGGLDLLQSANSLHGLKNLSITTRKSPGSLGMEVIMEEQLLFEGTANDAIEQFPQNMNVALLLSLATIGPEMTRVQVIVDPLIEKNTHTIKASGDFGKMTLIIENNPMPNNPKTSYLAALSIISTLQNKDESFRIGS
ncbi:aspartate dehydrogenase [Sporosarcina sp. P21c]|uniref:aspartate dehydrogenase n=1 Tax=unclassified Sporosarcina TaxID=2647733 RepID=UPI000C172889|nr:MULTISPECIES: aspartate dehydrogenase [unclassified Sporosarcina]PIC65809.1 aspartate dehydrogenase [Sporosarcina sp. P16a]PIC87521.1 aspartate dehydrogenase [Sporosarcina sp. P21c]PIC91414.1 aspartate dehydrogenase [Sporosarcina sp. P25]